MNIHILADIVLNPFGQVLGVMSGLLIMAGSLVGYQKFEIDGIVAIIFASAGLGLIAFGIGGMSLLHALGN
jgi:hypothetical protein